MKTWYALQKDTTDPWDNGTFDKEEALRMLNESDEYKLIAVIENGDYCAEEIWKD